MQPLTKALISVGAIFVILNWACLITSLVTKKFHSMVPPLGGLLILLGLLFDPNWRHLAWLGLIVDAGFWAIIFVLPELIRQFRRSSKSGLKLSLSGRSEDLEVQLILFQPDYYEIKLTRLPSSKLLGWQSRGSLGTWMRNGDRIELISHTNKPEHPSRAVLVRSLGQDHYEVTESTFAVSGVHDAPELPPVSFQLGVDQSK